MQNQNKSNSNIPTVEIYGKNKSHRICENSNNMDYKNCPYIYPHIKLNMDVSSILSYSTCYATIIVTSDGTAKVIGSNEEEQISSSLPKRILDKFTSINLKNSNGDSYFIISAICGYNYILYLTENKSKNTKSLIYWNSNLISNFPIVIKNDVSNPLALFGGLFRCCAIDDDGSIILIPDVYSNSEKILITKICLPNNDKAINVAFYRYSIFALGLSGKVYKKNIGDIGFTIVEELKKEQIVWISGFLNICYFVNKKGKVFFYGEIDIYDYRFEKTAYLMQYKIAKVFTAKSHTIFQTIEGKLIAQGTNKYGELLLSEGPSEGLYFSGMTMVDNASFCVVGPHSTIVFKNFIPLMSPNQNVDARKFVSSITKNRLNANYTATQDIKVKRKKLQQNSNQNDTPKNKKKIDYSIIEMWNHFINKKDEDRFYIENGVLNKNHFRDPYYFESKEPNYKLIMLFKYNKSNHFWEYIDDSFNRLIKETNQSEKDPVPLVLLIDTFYEDIHMISKMFTNGFNKYINFGNDIAIYAFQDEYTTKKSVFLFLFCSEFFCNMKSCESLFYQIYIFLFLICDLSIIVLDKFDIGKIQISFIQKVIKLSDLYLKGFIGSSNSDKNFSIPMKASEKNEKLFSDKSQLFIINKESDNDLKILIQQDISKKYYYDEGNHYKHFMSIFNSIKFNNIYLPVDINTAFKYINSYFPQITELYISHFYDCTNNILHFAISKSFDELKQNKMKNNTNEEIVQFLRNESQIFYPKFDIDFCKLLEIKFLDVINDHIIIDENYIKTKLDEYSALQIDNIKKEINEMDYLSKDEIETITDTHLYFLYEQFFEIVKEKYGENMLGFAFEKSFDIINSKSSEDSKTLSKIFDDFNEKNKIKDTIEFQSFDDAGKKRANYVVKETQVSRQIKIIINSDKDLETEIPQDF